MDASTLLSPVLSPVTSRMVPQIQHPQSPSWSPTRLRNTDDLLSDLSPATTLLAFTSPSGKLRASVEAASPSERAFGIRASLASKKIQEWVDELSQWPWPAAGGSVGFEQPVAKRRKISLESRSEHRGEQFEDEDEDAEKYIGSLLAQDVVRYAARVEEIRDDMDDLDVEEIKSRVLDSFSPRSRPSSSQSSAPLPSFLSSYTRMEDFTAVVTATVLQALPNLSRLMRLMDVWSIRLTVLTKVPPLLSALDDAEIALRSGWEAIRRFDYRKTSNKEPSEDDILSRSTFEVMRNVLQEKVTALGRDLDFMLDTLEGKQDTLPDSWLDRMEVIEQDYGEWAVSGDRKVREGEWAKMAYARNKAEEERKAREAADAAERERLLQEQKVKEAAEAAEKERLLQEQKTREAEKAAEMERLLQEQKAKKAAEAAEKERLLQEQKAREAEEAAEIERLLQEQKVKEAEEAAEKKRLLDEKKSRVAKEAAEKQRLIDDQKARGVAEAAERKRLLEAQQAKEAEAAATIAAAIAASLAATERLLQEQNIRGAHEAVDRQRCLDEQAALKATSAAEERAIAEQRAIAAGLELNTMLYEDANSREATKSSPSGCFDGNSDEQTSRPSFPEHPTQYEHGDLNEVNVFSLSENCKNDAVEQGEALQTPSTPTLSSPSTTGNVFGSPLSRQDDNSFSPQTPSNKSSRIGGGWANAVRESDVHRETLGEEQTATPQSNSSTATVKHGVGVPLSPTSVFLRENTGETSPSPVPSDLGISHAVEVIQETNCEDSISKPDSRGPSLSAIPVSDDTGSPDYENSFAPQLFGIERAEYYQPVLSPIHSPRRGHFSASPPYVDAPFSGDTVLPSIETSDYESSICDREASEEPSQFDGSFASQPERRNESENMLTDYHGLDISVTSFDASEDTLTRNSEDSRPGSSASYASTTVTGKPSSTAGSPIKFIYDNRITSTSLDAETTQDFADYDPPSPSAGRIGMRGRRYDISPSGSPEPALPRRPLERPVSTPSPGPELLPSIEDDDSPANFSSFASLKSKSSNDQMQQQISSILETLPGRIRLSSDAGASPPATYSVRSRKSRASLTANYPRSHSSMSTSRSPTPFLTLAPAYAKNPRPRPSNGNPDIKVYHLSRSTGEAPIKLFVRLVGEHGERVMVRVGGGWADLGEYLKEYAAHHGRRPGSGIDLDKLGKVEIQDLPPRMVSGGSFRSGRDSPAPRPATAMDRRPSSSFSIRRPRKSVGVADEMSSISSLRSPSTPLQTTTERSGSRMGWTDDESASLGLAGPKGKRKDQDLSPENAAWVENMKEKVRQASAEKEKKAKEAERKEKFGNIDRVGATKRLFPKSSH
ncbi:hypothetical protein BP5796_00018 [Coleophoma crateriformis]|uniref:GAR domain-containing protein n=1 Tax=Coleophoma crateriformis TaxID=565419 RepID=A0A3D8T6T0_9HELO|nr:hypothetical protein BP5796_00018 [Coleophoma crateriformis]